MTFQPFRSLFESKYFLAMLQRVGLRYTVIILSISGFLSSLLIMIPINYATGGSIITGLIVTLVISTTFLPLHVYQVGHLILQLHNAQDLLYHSSITDELTSTYNRRYAINQLNQFESNPQILAYALLLIDIDHFKKINDTYGHPTGDLVLVHFTRMCQIMLRASDTLARYGGEEFLCLLPHTAQTEALTIAERLCTSIAQTPIVVPGYEPIMITISIGVAAQQQASATAERLLGQADQALYLAKQHGRNQVRLA